MSSQRSSAERRVVTVLFVDVVGSTSLAEAMDPEDWSDVVNRALAVISPCVERFDGCIVQFAGDSVLALFGAPTAHEDDPYRAVRAAFEVLGAVERLSGEVERELGVEVRVRAGINTGLVVAGGLSAGDLNVYTALGDTANVAARMQGLAEPGSLVISEATYRLVSNDVDVEGLGPTAVKGKAEPMSVYRVTGVRGIDTRTRGIPGLESPMVGREEELTALVGLVDAVNAGRGGVAAIVGEPGVGKSRLLAELRERIHGMDGARLALCRSASYDERRPYHLIASLLRAIAGAGDSETLGDAATALRRSVEPLLGADDPNLDPLLQLLGVEAGHQDDKAEVLRGSYVAALVEVVSRLAERNKPLVLAFEDIHWSDASSAELLVEVLRELQHVPLLVVVLSRPDRASHGWDVLESLRRDRGEALTELRLEPLAEDDSRRLVANLLEIESLPETVRDAVLDRSEGNPFFLEEIVRMLIERRLIERVGERWVAGHEIAGLNVPDTLQGLLAARVDMLSVAAQRTARIASVVGRRFEARLLDDIVPRVQTGEGEGRAGADLGELETSGFVRLATTRPQLEFVFRHALVHEVIYGSLLRRERQRLHRHVAQAIEAHHQGRLDEQAAVLARHYIEARMPDRAVRNLMIAGRQALARHARQEARDFFAQALAQLGVMEDAPPRLTVEATLGQAQAGRAFIPAPEMLASLDAAVGAADEVGDADLTGRLELERLQTWDMMGDLQLPEARAATQRLYALKDDIRDHGILGRLESMRAWERRAVDDFSGTETFFRRAVPHLEAADRPSEAAVTAAYLADVLATVGRFEEAESWLSRGAAMAQVSGDPNAMADVDLFRGKVASERGDLEEALAHTHRGVEEAEAAGNVFCTLAGNFLAGDQELRRGRADVAVAHLGKSNELAAFCRAGPFEMLGAVWLATARARLGQVEPGDFDGPLEQAKASGSRMAEGQVRLQRGIALSGDAAHLPAALEDLEAAADLFGEIGARPLEARALHAHGRALEVAGDPRGARSRLDRAETIFEELGISPDRDALVGG